MTEFELNSVLKHVEAHLGSMVRELNSIVANDHALLCALIESHPYPDVLHESVRTHLLAQQAAALNTSMNEGQVNSLIDNGNRTLDWIEALTRQRSAS